MELGLDDRAAPHLNRGNCLHHLYRFDEAIDEYDRAIRKAPQSALARQSRGVAREYQSFYWKGPGVRCRTGELKSELEEALVDLQDAVRLNPSWGEARSK